MPSRRACWSGRYRGFVRSGAQLGPEDKTRLAAINERLAALGTQFSQNVLKDESSYALILEDEAELAGLPPFLHGGDGARRRRSRP